MRIAVLTLTRDRLEYTKHCFERLRERAGCDFDHYVLDQGSMDETVRYLDDYNPFYLYCSPENLGIMAGVNKLLDAIDLVQDADGFTYDVLVKIDNDCEIVTENSLRDVAEASLELNALLSPRVRGLMNPPVPTHSSTLNNRWQVLHVEGNIGGIFLSCPRSFFDGWHRASEEKLPKWGMDDVLMCSEAERRGMIVGYLDGYYVNHFETTAGQHARYPWYFERRAKEGGPK